MLLKSAAVREMDHLKLDEVRNKSADPVRHYKVYNSTVTALVGLQS